MTKRMLWIIAVVAAAASLWWAFAQQAPQPLEALTPAGALLYLEARDFGALARDWDASVEKRAWLASSNYGVFSRSHLFLRLADAQKEFAQAAGVPPDYALLSSVAGGASALAFYDIGKLQFLYLTRLPSARALNSALWRARGTYQTRRAANVDYYVKTDGQRTAAFAYTGDLLLVATREDLLSSALELVARQNRPALASEAWFTAAVQAAPAGARDLRLVYNMERLAVTPQFRSHWVQRNASDLREFSSGLADLERATGEMRERRVLLRASPSTDLTSTEAPAGQLLAMAPDEAGLYRLSAQPTPEHAVAWIEDKLFAPARGAVRTRTQAPFAPAAFDAGAESDLETRIDEAPLADDRAATAFAALRQRLAAMPLEAMLELQSTRVDAGQVFVRPQSAVVVLARQAWDANAMRSALTEAANGAWTYSGLGAGWRNGNNGTQELDGLGSLILAVDGNRLVLGDSAILVNAVLARRAQPAVAGAVYQAGWRHARELPNFERLSRLIDFPELRPIPEGAPDEGRQPMFYSENLASLGRWLVRVDSATLTRHDTGPLVRETVVYRMNP
jgi:hypothetical protein